MVCRVIKVWLYHLASIYTSRAGDAASDVSRRTVGQHTCGGKSAQVLICTEAMHIKRVCKLFLSWNQAVTSSSIRRCIIHTYIGYVCDRLLLQVGGNPTITAQNTVQLN